MFGTLVRFGRRRYTKVINQTDRFPFTGDDNGNIDVNDEPMLRYAMPYCRAAENRVRLVVMYWHTIGLHSHTNRCQPMPMPMP